MDIEDLILKYYRVEKIDGRIVATENPCGKYRSRSAEEVEEALSTDRPVECVDVRIGNKWMPIRHPKKREPKRRWRREYYYA